MHFTKMEGCGNDYIYINGFVENVKNPEKLAVAMSERHFGVGADGLVLILPSEIADFRMRMFNLDGSEGEMCGNAVRCIGKYVYERGLTKKQNISLETLGGIKYLQLQIKNEIVEQVVVDMGEPILKAADIPVLSKQYPVLQETLTLLDKTFSFTCVSTGNPHAVTFLESVECFAVEKYGALAEVADIFPNKSNIEFAEVRNRNQIRMRVWERGTGETLACGTGACATLVAAVLHGYTERKAEILLTGGTLIIEWNETDNHIYMTGPAAFSFDGVWLRDKE